MSHSCNYCRIYFTVAKELEALKGIYFAHFPQAYYIINFNAIYVVKCVRIIHVYTQCVRMYIQMYEKCTLGHNRIFAQSAKDA